MSDAEEEASTGGNGKRGGGGGKNHNKYRKDKPWDSASIDHWSIPDWKDETMKVSLEGGLQRSTSSGRALRSTSRAEEESGWWVVRLYPGQCMMQPRGHWTSGQSGLVQVLLCLTEVWLKSIIPALPYLWYQRHLVLCCSAAAAAMILPAGAGAAVLLAVR